MTTPLSGRTVVVTRARSQASELVERLTALGAVVVELPVIAIGDPPDRGAALAAASDRLVAGAYAWVVLTSANAGARLLAALAGRRVPPAVQWAAVGPVTARALEVAGYAAALMPRSSDAEALVDAFPPAPLAATRSVPPATSSLAGSSAGSARAGSSPAGTSTPAGTTTPAGTSRGSTESSPSPEPGPDGSASVAVLFPRAEAARDILAPGLRAKGWVVDEVVAYRTTAAHPDDGDIAAARHADAVVFASPSAVERTIDLLTAGGIPGAVASIGPATSAAARTAGLVVSAEAEHRSVDGLVEAVVRALASREEQR